MVIALLANITPAMCWAVTPSPTAICGRKNFSHGFKRGGSSRFSFGSSARTSTAPGNKGHPHKFFAVISRTYHLDDHRRGDQVSECQRYHRLPGQIHELVVPKPRQRPAHPHHEDDHQPHLEGD